MSDQDQAAFFNQFNAPFGKVIGANIISATKARIEAELVVRDELCTVPPTLHGGAVMALADNLGGIGAIMNLPEGAATSTIESKTSFLRAAPVGETVRAVSTPIKIGRTLQVWETRITNESGVLVAIVTQTQIVLYNNQ